MSEQIYYVAIDGHKARLISAPTRVQAVRHAYRIVTARVASQADLVSLLLDDPTPIEHAGHDDETNPYPLADG